MVFYNGYRAGSDIVGPVATATAASPPPAPQQAPGRSGRDRRRAAQPRVISTLRPLRPRRQMAYELMTVLERDKVRSRAAICVLRTGFDNYLEMGRRRTARGSPFCACSTGGRAAAELGTKKRPRRPHLGQHAVEAVPFRASRRAELRGAAAPTVFRSGHLGELWTSGRDWLRATAARASADRAAARCPRRRLAATPVGRCGEARSRILRLRPSQYQISQLSRRGRRGGLVPPASSCPRRPDKPGPTATVPWLRSQYLGYSVSLLFSLSLFSLFSYPTRSSGAHGARSAAPAPRRSGRRPSRGRSHLPPGDPDQVVGIDLARRRVEIAVRPRRPGSSGRW